MTAILLSMLMLSEPSTCVGQVVAINSGNQLVLYGRDLRPVARIAAKDGRLPAALPITQCTQTKVLVRYQGQSLIAERWQLVYDQPLIVCPATVTGGREGQVMLGGMQALDKCPDPPRDRR